MQLALNALRTVYRYLVIAMK